MDVSDEVAETRGYRSLGGTVSATPGGAVAPLLICDDHIECGDLEQPLTWTEVRLK